MGWIASRSAFVHLYINGLYWGLYEPSERINASYFAQHYGGQEIAWDVVVGEDNNGPPVLVDGSLTDWNNVLNPRQRRHHERGAYQAVAALVDLDNLIDYMMLHIFAESEDWPRHNWYVAHRRADERRARNEIHLHGVGPGTDARPARARCQPQSRQRRQRRRRSLQPGSRLCSNCARGRSSARHFGDRVHKHLFNGGALTPSNNVARLLASAAIIRNALVGESARWGDARKTGVPAGPIGTGVTFTRDEWWQPEIDKLATNFFQKLTADNRRALSRRTACIQRWARPSSTNSAAASRNGFALAITHTNVSGTIYFTTDGSDPRTYGSGAVAPSAQAYSAPVAINTPTIVRARVLDGANWSALVEAVFYPPQDLSKLALTEMMYHPPDVGLTNGDEFEFLELKNTGTNTLNLSGLTFSGISFTFTNGTMLAPGQFFVLVRNPAAFAAKYPGVTVPRRLYRAAR